MLRQTRWADDAGHLVQVAVAVLDDDTWELRAEVTEQVGPFDDPWHLISECARRALALAEGRHLLE